MHYEDYDTKRPYRLGEERRKRPRPRHRSIHDVLSSLVLIGFLLLGGGVLSVLLDGLTVINGTIVLLGGISAYYWLREEKTVARYDQLIGELDEQLSTSRNPRVR